MKGGSTKSDDHYQKAEMLKAIRCYRNLHCPEYAFTVKAVLSGHRIKRTPSIKRTVAEGPKFISLIYFK